METNFISRLFVSILAIIIGTLVVDQIRTHGPGFLFDRIWWSPTVMQGASGSIQDTGCLSDNFIIQECAQNFSYKLKDYKLHHRGKKVRLEAEVVVYLDSGRSSSSKLTAMGKSHNGTAYMQYSIKPQEMFGWSGMMVVDLTRIDTLRGFWMTKHMTNRTQMVFGNFEANVEFMNSTNDHHTKEQSILPMMDSTTVSLDRISIPH